MSANGYWRRLEDGIGQFDSIEDEAKLLVMSDDGDYIGHWNTLEEVEDFIINYMRGEILDIMLQS